MDAGCKKQKWGAVDIWPRLVGQGRLLAKTVCIDEGYTKNVAPDSDSTKVYTTIKRAKVRSVDSRDGTMSVDFLLAMIWQDPKIRAKFLAHDVQKGGIALNADAISEIWTPDLYIMDRKYFKPPNEWMSLKKGSILSPQKTKKLNLPPSITNRKHGATVEAKYEIKCTIHCQFQHSDYPMDNQNCSIHLGSGSFSAIFVLFSRYNMVDEVFFQITNSFNIEMKLFDSKTGIGNNTVGIHLKMRRSLKPFILKYYIPCIAIVLVSQLSFIIPLVTAILELAKEK